MISSQCKGTTTYKESLVDYFSKNNVVFNQEFQTIGIMI